MNIQDVQEIIELLMDTPTVQVLVVGVLAVILLALLIAWFATRSGRMIGKDMARILDQFIDLERGAKADRVHLDERQVAAVEKLVTGVDALNGNNRAVQLALEASGAAIDVLGRRIEAQHTEMFAIMQPVKASADDTTRVVLELRAMLARLETGQENLLGVAETLAERVAQQGVDAVQLSLTIEALTKQIGAYSGSMEGMFRSIRDALARVEGGV